jgi:hypothetical protein
VADSETSKECLSCKGIANLACGLCKGSLCKSCAEFAPIGDLSFFTKLPDELSHNQYCSICYVSQIIPRIENYKQLVKRAKGIFIVEKKPREGLRILKKSVKPLIVLACADREETFLRLAFQAAELGFNAVIQAKVQSQKIRNFGYQKMEWRGTGLAADLDIKDA